MKKLIITLLCCAVISTPSYAGSQQTAAPVFQPEEITTFAKSVEKYAAKQQARAFIIARMGRPKADLPKGISFTHTAIAIYSAITLDNGETVKGYAIHNLYQQADKLNRSDLVTDYPADFFWGAHSLQAGIIIPSAELQQRLIDIVSSGQNKTLHNPKYSVLANPFNNQYQNCTEYTLDMINAAIYQTTDSKQLKLNAKAHFKPQRVRTNAFKLALGSMFMDDVTTRDHKGKIYTTTFTTIAKYLTDNSLASPAVILDQLGAVQTL
ncbi:MAG: DUF2145 domain-containing protein [Thalassotalea sp.]